MGTILIVVLCVWSRSRGHPQCQLRLPGYNRVLICSARVTEACIRPADGLGCGLEMMCPGAGRWDCLGGRPHVWQQEGHTVPIHPWTNVRQPPHPEASKTGSLVFMEMSRHIRDCMRETSSRFDIQILQYSWSGPGTFQNDEVL